MPHWKQCKTLKELLTSDWFNHKSFDLKDDELNLMNILLMSERFNSRSEILRLTKQNGISLVNVEDTNEDKGVFNMSPNVKIKITNKVKVSLDDLNSTSFEEFDAIAIGKMPDIFVIAMLKHTNGWRIFMEC